MKWIKEGDKNTKFFQSKAKAKARRNYLNGVMVDDVWVSDVKGVKEAVLRHFKDRFEKEKLKSPVVYELNFKRLKEEEGKRLEEVVSLEELKNAVWDCEGSKAPGPDGFNFNFFKKSWLLIKDELMGFVMDFMRKGKMERGLNNAFITLIPKVNAPINLNDYRPISLVNSLYKILSKILANRLKKVLPSIISDTQSAFIGGRQIMDGVFVANEVIHSMKIKRWNKGGVVIKLDFEKAYDCVDWDFLISIMESMGFGQRWRNWIFECISTVRISILINGSPTVEFPTRKGLRQGDPLSLFLFLMVGEALHLLMVKAKNMELIRGIVVAKSGLEISHL